MKLSPTGKSIVNSSGKQLTCRCCNSCSCSGGANWLTICDAEVTGLTPRSCAKVFEACINTASAVISYHKFGEESCDGTSTLKPFDVTEDWSHLPRQSLPWKAVGGGGTAGLCSLATVSGEFDDYYRMHSSRYGQFDGCENPEILHDSWREPKCQPIDIACLPLASGRTDQPPQAILAWPWPITNFGAGSSWLSQFFCMDSGSDEVTETLGSLTRVTSTTVSHSWSVTLDGAAISTTVSQTITETKEIFPGVEETSTEVWHGTYQFAYTHKIVLDCEDQAHELTCESPTTSCGTDEYVIAGSLCPGQDPETPPLPPYYLQRNINACRIREHGGYCWIISPAAEAILDSERESGSILHYEVITYESLGPTACCICVGIAGSDGCWGEKIKDFRCAPGLNQTGQECCCHDADEICVETYRTKRTLYASEGVPFSISTIELAAPVCGTRGGGITFSVNRTVQDFDPPNTYSDSFEVTIPGEIPCGWNGAIFPGQYWWVAPTAFPNFFSEVNGNCPPIDPWNYEFDWVDNGAGGKKYIFSKTCSTFQFSEEHIRFWDRDSVEDEDYYIISRVENDLLIRAYPTGNCDSGCYGGEEPADPPEPMMLGSLPEGGNSAQKAVSSSGGCGSCRRKKQRGAST